jgi:hypothetical protein
MWRLLGAMCLFAGHQLPAQTGAFVATLGADTMHVERFTRTRDRLDGVIVTRVPRTRYVRYSLTFGANGEPKRYEVQTTEAEGTPVRTPGAAGSFTFLTDSLIRETARDGQPAIQRIATPAGAFPGPGLPYVGVSYLMYELAFADARRRANGAAEGAVHLLTMSPGQMAPQKIQVWFVGSDSVEMSYFGVAKSGYRFDAKGQLVRSDWTGTTYRYRIARVPNVDVDRLASAWAAADGRGAAMGAMSPRDTARATLDGAELSVEYSRPAKRGRVVWGEVVPWDTVWRLGADFATHFTTSRELRIGETEVPAGTYTLWMLPSSRGTALLIINTQTRIFGTAYNPTHDFARIPMTKSVASPVADRLTIAVDRGALWVRWDDVAWSVPVVVR